MKFPAAQVQQYIVSLIQQLAKMCPPLTISDGVYLANSLIDGPQWENVVAQFKTRKGWKLHDENGNKKPTLGLEW